jgi:8-amino-7-oxononanoate synthase
MRLLQKRLEQHKAQGLTRTLLAPVGVDFSSNDYLGFCADPELRHNFLNRLQQIIPQGAGGSRLLRGNLSLYEETEMLLARFVQRESALLFSSGYAANVGLLSAVLQPGDIVFSDAFNHASIIDGIRLSRAQKIIFPHRDYAFLADSLQTFHAHEGLKVIVTESVFSMEGTLADLRTLAELAQRFNALLIVDEAHSTGLWGASLVASLGLTEQVFATVHPAGKALGASGAWVAGGYLLKEYLSHFARSFLFSTAPIPALAILLQEVVKFYQIVGSERAAIVHQRSQMLRDLLRSQNPLSDGPIIPILIGDNETAVRMSRQLQERSWDVRAIRPPTVPLDTARLRVTVKWQNSEAELNRFASDLQEIYESF